MNRLFTILCMASLLVFHTSCNDSVMDLESPSAEMKTRTVDQRVQNLIQQARQGDVEAYNSLALCYRDGDGVEKSLLNMLCMYTIYSQKTGGDIENVLLSIGATVYVMFVFLVSCTALQTCLKQCNTL